ncbi:uncharacterized protein K441DRAFT_689142 [Cenococcum geophilum 1.58]|uniref:uncharacterized protein n=1 Tax=Cenococcum geophilum 1.58 TaxID=794803 RepID=UPI00358E3B08|nr:hypothetical protein K441DRAFT_689142 [Cenococcum geophilum 1.58]
MARTVTSAVVVREKYYWPDAQLNIWTIIMVSRRLHMTAMLFPYGVTVGALTIIFIIIELILIAQRRLLPGIMMLLSFVLLVLFITGIIGTAIQLFGGPNINNQCNTYVSNMKVTGPSINTLAWLQQNNICSCWSAAFAFWIIGSVFLIWMMIMASQVNQNQYD